jgi:hypothetical protein
MNTGPDSLKRGEWAIFFAVKCRSDKNMIGTEKFSSIYMKRFFFKPRPWILTLITRFVYLNVSDIDRL